MKFIVRNNAKIANKYIRFAKWRIRKLDSQFKKLIYTEIFINKEGQTPTLYNATLVLGVPGPDIIISAKSEDLIQLWSQLLSKMKRQLSKLSSK